MLPVSSLYLVFLVCSKDIILKIIKPFLQMDFSFPLEEKNEYMSSKGHKEQ